MTASTTSDVEVIFSARGSDDHLPERVILLKPGTTVQIGRSSKNSTRNLKPAEDNLWIESPVISRNHACISLEHTESGQPNVVIEDSGSSHGTFVNKQAIRGKGKMPLKHEDEVQFGDSVTRETATFKPPIYDVLVLPLPTAEAPPAPSTTAGYSFSVPDDCSDVDSEEEMEESEDDIESHHSGSSTVPYSAPPLPPRALEFAQNVTSRVPVSQCWYTPVPPQSSPFVMSETLSDAHVAQNLGERQNSPEYEPPHHFAAESLRESYSYKAEVESDNEADIYDEAGTDVSVDVRVSDESDEDDVESDEDLDQSSEIEADTTSTPQSPCYMPTSPTWIEGPNGSANPNYPMIDTPDLPVSCPQGYIPLVYATKAVDHTDVISLPQSDPFDTSASENRFDQPYSTARNTLDHTLPVETWASFSQHKSSYLDKVLEESSNTTTSYVLPPSSVTRSTQDHLDAARATKLSINHLMNPVDSVGSKKRKADEIEELQEAQECYDESIALESVAPVVPAISAVTVPEPVLPMSDAAEPAENATKSAKDATAKTANDLVRPAKDTAKPSGVARVHAPNKRVALAPRPQKRLRTLAKIAGPIVAHAATFTAGGIATIALLATLPNNYFA